VLAWLCLLIIPTRYLVLFGGICQFLLKFFPQPKEFPNVIRCDNLLASIPNDEDLRKVYYWEIQEYQRLKRDGLQVGRRRIEAKCVHHV